jgi:muramoyltetrapeptide carboxypeptidase LdcA involved in peptidoglycan recycling
MKQGFRKPERLRRNDAVAVLSPSKGNPSRFPQVYELGIRNLEEKFGLRVKEYPTARADATFLYRNPKKRAEDVNNAFADEEVKAIIATIGGDESVRILPHLDREMIRDHPKILMGYSDVTTLLTYCTQLGLVTFHGPMIMAGFSQLNSLPTAFTDHITEVLFKPQPTYAYQRYDVYSDGYPDWANTTNLGKVNEPRSNPGWTWLQGNSCVRGELFGGCIEVLDFMKGTVYWPSPNFWEGKILFLETSEEKPSPTSVERWLRNYGMQGVFDKISALLFGRARDYSELEKKHLDSLIVSVVAKEFNQTDLPIVTNMDFGHTDPQFILPLGITAEIDCLSKRFRLLEPPVV